ncbi:MAG TPA: hypothetical protein VE981_07105 [Planctomycetota bacterium]|nr:hypothetical protein [Planctomycetota bacterium]
MDKALLTLGIAGLLFGLGVAPNVRIDSTEWVRTLIILGVPILFIVLGRIKTQLDRIESRLKGPGDVKPG